LQKKRAIKPETVNILGVNYAIKYEDNPVFVDMNKRESLWGQTDFWTRTIRIYDKTRSFEDVFQTLLHEIIHVISEELHLKALQNYQNDDIHDSIDLLALGMADVMLRNEWIRA